MMQKEVNNKTTVHTKENGPIIITGQFTFDNDKGEKVELERLVLCRCGASGKMPLCDASHNRIGFCSE